jgi:hypothetical protein
MGDPTSSYANVGIALRASGALKPQHHDKVETPSVGFSLLYYETFLWASEVEPGISGMQGRSYYVLMA